MQRFVRTVNHDIEAVSHAAIERCNNGLVEGQINRLKTLKRAMYARAGPGSRHFYIEIVRQMTKTRVSCSATPSASIG
jgi:transposase